MLSLSKIDPAFRSLLPYGLAVFRGAIDNDTCQACEVELASSTDWQPLHFGRYHEGELVHRSDDADIQALVNYGYVFPTALEGALKRGAAETARQAWSFNQIAFSRFTASRLSLGMQLGPHRDSRYADTGRLVSVVSYLSSGFQGGDLMFPGFSLTISPGRGDVIMFFSEHEHVVEEVMEGERQSGVFFLEHPKSTA